VGDSPITVRADSDLRAAAQPMLTHELRELPVTDETGRVVGFLDEADVSRACLEATAQPDRSQPHAL
jgi:chloride channel protein, CIC family